jgi:integral membrane protein
MWKNNVKKLGLINTIEGNSYLLLLFVAMPLKYMFALPMAVKFMGMAHGVIFVIFVLLLVESWNEKRWPFYENFIFFIATLIPFGTFFTKKRIKSYE